jgi:Cytochrome c7 and related cytochrome c
MRIPKSWGTWLFLGTLSACAFALMAAAMSSRPSRSPEQVQGPGGDIFTPAHPSVGAAFREFFAIRSEPVQPIAFTHKAHLANNLTCEICHTAVAQGPQAGIPSAKFCMACHLVIAADKPEIKKVAAFVARGEDIPWQRVYGYSPSAHVRFNHAPHIRAGVACANCHGDVAQQTVAVRAVSLDMGDCVSCHQERKASVDCQTCHY